MGLLKRFGGDRRASVVPLFAISIIPLTGLVGAAVDYTRASAARTAMQSALDSTTLAIAKNATTVMDQDPSGAALSAQAETYFRSVFDRPEVAGLTVNVAYSKTDGSRLVVSGKGTIETTFLRVLGSLGGADFSTLPVSGSSTAVWGNSRLRVALVLDNTGSMASAGKMDALKTASKNLIEQLKNAAQKDGDVYVSVVPFAKDVNVAIAPDTHTASWIDWSDWEAPPAGVTPSATVGPGSSCPFSTRYQGFGCTTGPATGSSNASYIPSSGAYKGYICPSVDNGKTDQTRNGHYYNGCWTSTPSGRAGYWNHTWVVNDHSTWTGCVLDRDQNSDTTNVAPGVGPKFPAQQYSYCNTALMPLSYDWAALKAKVDAMQPAGSTNQTIGLAWGWQSLTRTAPLNAPDLDPTYKYKQVIILLSDGLNTQNRWSGNGSAVSSAVDGRTRLACESFKGADETNELYTIQVNTGGDPTSTLLRDCASNSPGTYDHFFELKTADQIVTTFDEIGTKMSKLRIAE
ncbi:hypothetical protein A33M_2725 [Rhodovulum sp. PH10]|uniref:TadE/TadG family type IV pilus assembly protein n=1 Tax=Rhodovulum sp. PH10 TaxID=1187851 RepID=UPI00027C2523|nr:TadE/TadG family type IV pilus assembly protein [Rhodovulum sp. PH10]EJW11820.1 hypothetical protein A33M_2725 [Rhodovulum sp. PH10]